MPVVVAGALAGVLNMDYEAHEILTSTDDGCWDSGSSSATTSRSWR